MVHGSRSRRWCRGQKGVCDGQKGRIRGGEERQRARAGANAEGDGGGMDEGGGRQREASGNGNGNGVVCGSCQAAGGGRQVQAGSRSSEGEAARRFKCCTEPCLCPFLAAWAAAAPHHPNPTEPLPPHPGHPDASSIAASSDFLIFTTAPVAHALLAPTHPHPHPHIHNQSHVQHSKPTHSPSRAPSLTVSR